MGFIKVKNRNSPIAAYVLTAVLVNRCLVALVYNVYISTYPTVAGLWSLVAPNRNPGEVGSPLADHSLLLILVLIHQQTKAHNPFRTALYTFSDEHGGKAPSSFSISLEKLYLTVCR